jgi:competence protein ComEA
MARKLLIVLMMLSMVSMAAAGWAEGTKININTASAEELTQLDKVGEKYAQRIVAYREANGKFAAPEDIMKVKGIGQKVFDANKDVIIVGDAVAKKP